MSPRTIAVDLTPVLPGGENGGAKVFALALVRALAIAQPATNFVLLTQAASHEELSVLDADNVRRVMVIGPAASSQRARMFGLAGRVLARSPAFVRRRAAGIGYRVHHIMKRRGSGSLLRGMGADVLLCPFTAPTYREPGIPAVCTIHDVQFRAYPQFFAAEDVEQRNRTFLDACRHAAALVAVSHYSRDAAIAEGKLDAARIRTIYERIAPAAESNAAVANEALPRMGLQRGRFLLYPANFWKHKNHEMLLAAFALACRNDLPRDVKLVCTGAPSPRTRWLAQAAHALGLGDRVIFAGFLSHADLVAAVSQSAGLVFPSLYEGFGLPVIESMALGAPVACSNVTALPEIAGDAALLFDPRKPDAIANAMVLLVTDSQLRERLVAAGRRRAAEFSDAARMAAEYWDLMREALA